MQTFNKCLKVNSSALSFFQKVYADCGLTLVTKELRDKGFVEYISEEDEKYQFIIYRTAQDGSPITINFRCKIKDFDQVDQTSIEYKFLKDDPNDTSNYTVLDSKESLELFVPLLQGRISQLISDNVIQPSGEKPPMINPAIQAFKDKLIHLYSNSSPIYLDGKAFNLTEKTEKQLEYVRSNLQLKFFSDDRVLLFANDEGNHHLLVTDDCDYIIDNYENELEGIIKWSTNSLIDLCYFALNNQTLEVIEETPEDSINLEIFSGLSIGEVSDISVDEIDDLDAEDYFTNSKLEFQRQKISELTIELKESRNKCLVLQEQVKSLLEENLQLRKVSNEEPELIYPRHNITVNPIDGIKIKHGRLCDGDEIYRVVCLSSEFNHEKQLVSYDLSSADQLVSAYPNRSLALYQFIEQHSLQEFYDPSHTVISIQEDEFDKDKFVHIAFSASEKQNGVDCFVEDKFSYNWLWKNDSMKLIGIHTRNRTDDFHLVHEYLEGLSKVLNIVKDYNPMSFGIEIPLELWDNYFDQLSEKLKEFKDQNVVFYVE